MANLLGTNEAHARFDSVVNTLANNLELSHVVQSMGEIATAKYIDLLAFLAPVTKAKGVATLSRMQIKNDKITLVIAHPGEKIRLSKSLHSTHTFQQLGNIASQFGKGFNMPHDLYANAGKSVVAYNFTDVLGMAIWLDGSYGDKKIQSRPVAAINSVQDVQSRSSVLLHELVHLDQCIREPVIPKAIDERAHCALQELEAYHIEHQYENGQLLEGLYGDVRLIKNSSNVAVIDFCREKYTLKSEPYKLTPRLERALREKGVFDFIVQDEVKELVKTA